MLREIYENMNEGKILVVKKKDWDDAHMVFNPLNPETDDYDIFIGWNDDEFGAEIDGDGIEGNFKTVAKWLKKRKIDFSNDLYKFGLKQIK